MTRGWIIAAIGLAAVVFVLILSEPFGEVLRTGEELDGKEEGIVPQEGIRVPIESSVGEDPHGRARF